MKVHFKPEDVFAALTTLATKRPDGRRVKRSLAENAANSAGQARRRERLRREAWERRQAIEAARPKKRRPAYGYRVCDRLLVAMQPGQWHTAPDVTFAAGLVKGNRSALILVLAPAGMVESARDPDWIRKPGGYKQAPGFPGVVWRLTALGEIEREAVLLLQ